MSFIVRGNFFCKFKIGDNVRYNLLCLEALYQAYDSGSSKIDHPQRLRKSMILIHVSIIEAVLYDFHLRARVNVIEGIINVSQEVISHIQGKRYDELGAYIDSVKKHDIFSEPDSSFYERLHELRKVRNRIHIQNLKRYEPLNEREVYTERVLLSAERCLEKVLKTMSEKYFRENGLGDYVGDLRCPWSHHFD